MDLYLWRDHNVASFLRTARAAPEGVWLGRRPRWRNADIVLAPYGLLVQHRGASTSLGWGDPSWSFGTWPAGATSDLGGVAIVSPAAVAALHSSWWPMRPMRPGARSDRLPLDASKTDPGECEAVTRLLEALRSLLLRSPDISARLADPERVRQLAEDLRDWSAPERDRSGVPRRREQTIAEAMHRARVEHPERRPYPDWEAPAMADVIGRVRVHLSRPEPGGPELTDDEIGAVVAASYFDVTPWPFEALLR